jgi:hypothetical protein
VIVWEGREVDLHVESVQIERGEAPRARLGDVETTQRHLSGDFR